MKFTIRFLQIRFLKGSMGKKACIVNYLRINSEAFFFARPAAAVPLLPLFGFHLSCTGKKSGVKKDVPNGFKGFPRLLQFISEKAEEEWIGHQKKRSESRFSRGTLGRRL